VCEASACNFTEGVYIDYRHFDQNNLSVRYPFGHGLSYTTFDYSVATAEVTNGTAFLYKHPTGSFGLGGEVDLWDEVMVVSTIIQNVGAADGAEVAQLYVSFPAEAAQPVKVLRGFEKPFIAVGESAEVFFSLRRRDLSYWDVLAQKWSLAGGLYTFSVGASSRDIRATTTVTLTAIEYDNKVAYIVE
jgi:beta-glucosidase